MYNDGEVRHDWSGHFGCKKFMAGILTGSMFDKFYLRDGEIQTFTEFHLGGYLNRPYFDSEEWEALGGRELCLWAEVKPFAFQLIKGHKLPVRFKLVFQLSDENTGGCWINTIFPHRWRISAVCL